MTRPESGMTPERIDELNALQYGDGVLSNHDPENASSMYSDVRRMLYARAEDGRNVWDLGAEALAPKIESAEDSVTMADIGAGNGFFYYEHIFPKFGDKVSYMGINNMSGQVNAAREIQRSNEKNLGRPLHAGFMLGDAHQLPFDDESVDIVVKHFLDHHLHDPLLSMREIFRVLKPGGQVELGGRNVPNQDRTWRLAAYVTDRVNQFEGRQPESELSSEEVEQPGRLEYVKPISFYTACDVDKQMELAREAGFKSVGEPIEQKCKIRLGRDDFWRLEGGIMALQTVMTNKNREFPSAEALRRVILGDIKYLYDYEIRANEKAGKGPYFTDQVDQVVSVWEKPRLYQVT